MSFKFFLSLFFLAFFFGCGVKARPVVPPEKAISSYIESYTGAPVELKKTDSEKKK